MSEDRERRIFQRTDAALPVRVVAGGTAVEAESVNLSEGGVLVAGADFPEADVVRIEIELAELGWQALDAEVVRRESRDDGDQALAARFASAAIEGGRSAIQEFFASRIEPPRP